MNARRSVLIVGSMAFDDLELPSGSFKDVVGGSATYASFAAAALASAGSGSEGDGAWVRVVAVVGDDFPEATLVTMQSRGIDTTGVERARGRTFRWAGKYSDDLAHRTTLDTQLNVFADFRPKIPAAYQSSPIVMLGNIHPALQIEVLDQVAKPELVIADTMNFWIEGEPALVAALLRRVDLLVVNDEEARLLSGEHNIRRAARAILAKGPRSLIIKRGEHGALLFDDAGVFAAPGYPLEVVCDPTGAGDSFAGGFVGYLAAQQWLDGLSARRAMIYGTATASSCVEAVGTEATARLTRDQVTSRVRAICELYDFGAHAMFTRD